MCSSGAKEPEHQLKHKRANHESRQHRQNIKATNYLMCIHEKTNDTLIWCWLMVNIAIFHTKRKQRLCGKQNKTTEIQLICDWTFMKKVQNGNFQRFSSFFLKKKLLCSWNQWKNRWSRFSITFMLIQTRIYIVAAVAFVWFFCIWQKAWNAIKCSLFSVHL